MYLANISLHSESGFLLSGIFFNFLRTAIHLTLRVKIKHIWWIDSKKFKRHYCDWTLSLSLTLNLSYSLSCVGMVDSSDRTDIIFSFWVELVFPFLISISINAAATKFSQVLPRYETDRVTVAFWLWLWTRDIFDGRCCLALAI